jgi:hypothetical protein
LLPNLTGLGATTSIRGNLTIDNNATMTNLSGLGPIVSIGPNFARNLLIKNNAALTSLSGLGSVTSVGGYIEIVSNAVLTDITDLSGVTSIGTYLKFEDNAILTSLAGLDNINPSSITDLTIQNSSSLSVCEAPSICAYLLADPLNPATIAGNASGCNTRSEIEAVCPLLPIEMVYFEGKLVNNKPTLFWQTASESNNDYFQIEHHLNGVGFVEIGRIAGNGTTQERSNYRFIHEKPIIGANYYRLKQVDFNGSYTYSKIVNVIFESKEIDIFPNPTASIITIVGIHPAGGASIRVTNEMGQLVKSAQLTTNTFDLSDLPKGLYFVTIFVDNQVVTKRMVVK